MLSWGPALISGYAASVEQLLLQLLLTAANEYLRRTTHWLSLSSNIRSSYQQVFLRRAELKDVAKFAGIPIQWRSFSSIVGGLDLQLHLWVAPSVTNVTEAFYSKYLKLTWLEEPTRMEAPSQYLHLSVKVFLHNFKESFSSFLEKCIYVTRMVFQKSFKIFKITLC